MFSTKNLLTYSVIVINTLRVFVKSREEKSKDWRTNWKCELASCLGSALCASVVCVSLMKNTSPSFVYYAACAFTYSGSAFESPGLQALDCRWWQRLPTVPSWVLNWPLIPRAREQRCFLRTSAGTVQSCCLKKSTGYVPCLCTCREGAIWRRQWMSFPLYSFLKT